MTLEEYIDSAEETRKERLIKIIDLIKELYPNCKESIKYKMPTYEYQSGWVSVANKKNYISVYTCREDHIHEFKTKHPEIKSGKGCLNFKDRDEINYNDLISVIKSALEYKK